MSGHTIIPLRRTDGVNLKLTGAICIIALVLLVFGNNAVSKDLQFWGTDLDDLLNNVGLAMLIAAITQ